MSVKQCIILCNCIHDIIELESKLKAAGILCDLIPTPRHLSADCGMSVIIRASDQNRAASIITSMGDKCKIVNSGQ
ncbi:MAG: hypothetical protein A2Y62_22110 [Candidatus Fischerbacteria bacterium RBG_13_37_8]|uniref:Putative Se/S carrier protein-like domain-containing protein n=1 Tax=Candidatus Fischerbacteria bacterium RBG_13_37_8 TaxID=1817863 RepID=A0A1F5VXE5_9BACT|nr:MAG: hypothetical protein A2Y62_22110 [Candidatus Fischerbacteria bacterium RBG_13_37_8]